MQEIRERAAKLLARLHPIDYDFNVRLIADFALLERAEARREAIEECAKIAEDYAIYDGSARAVLNALRAKLAAPEKEETNVLDRK